jgi:hypothetical protein
MNEKFKKWINSQANETNDGSHGGERCYIDAELTEKETMTVLMLGLLARSPKGLSPQDRLKKIIGVFDNPDNFEVLNDVRCQRKTIKSLDAIVWS